MADEQQRKRLTFDPTINAGHVLTFVTLVIAGFTSWSLLDKRLTVVEQAQLFQRERDQHQDAQVANTFGEFKGTLTEIKRSVEEIRRDQLQQRRAP